jgi:hypothetical protein
MLYPLMLIVKNIKKAKRITISFNVYYWNRIIIANTKKDDVFNAIKAFSYNVLQLY